MRRPLGKEPVTWSDVLGKVSSQPGQKSLPGLVHQGIILFSFPLIKICQETERQRGESQPLLVKGSQAAPS
jgi:hypothetical protein